MPDNRRLRELLEEILESQRSAEEACAGDPELLSKVKRRLDSLRRVEDQIEAFFPAASPTPSGRARTPSPTSPELPKIDGYRIERVLGRGGMGIVYHARHLPLDRVVALKMLLAGQYASAYEIARFVRESRAVAKLQHPHIVQVYDVGEQEGRQYFTMELMEGGSLAQQLAGVPQTARRAAEVTATLAGAVQSAHQCGVVHRDLKPANILLARDGMLKIVDFGLARQETGEPSLTMSDARLGTPSYMAPEQALGRLGTIGPSVDIYALGAILYEMLTGRPPFRAETAIETERQVVSTEPVTPSRLNGNVPRDLETICLKCLRKDPARRYASAAELAADLGRFLNGQPIEARPIGLLERLQLWGARNRGIAAALAAIAFLLVVTVVGSLWAAAHFRRLEAVQRTLAKEKGDLADQKGELVVEKERERVKAVEAEQREAKLLRRSVEQGTELRSLLYLTEMHLGGEASTVPGGLGRVGELLAHWERELPDMRNWEWYYLNGHAHRSLRTRMIHGHSAHRIAWSPDGTRYAIAGGSSTLCLWDASTESPPRQLRGHTREAFSVSWSPDGRRLASASWDGTARIWNAADGTEQRCFRDHAVELFDAAWSPDGKTIASSGRDGVILLWNPDDGVIRATLRGHEAAVTSIAWSSDSRRLASCSHDSTVRVWDVAEGKPIHVLKGHSNWVNQVAWSPDDSRLASASNDRSVRLWNPKTGEELSSIRGHTQGVASVCWSPDGRQIASCGDDQTVRIWSADTGAEQNCLRGHTSALTTVAWSPRGDRILSGGYEWRIRLWDAATGPETPTLTDHQSPVMCAAWSPREAALFATSDISGVIRVRDFPGQQIRATFQGDEQAIHVLAWHPQGTRLAAGSVDGVIRLWNLAGGTEPVVLSGHADEVLSLAWNPDGRRLASSGNDNAIRIWDVTSGKVMRTLGRDQHNPQAIEWNPDGTKLASASTDRTVRVWDPETGEETLCYRGHSGQVLSVAWSPDGRSLASTGYDATVHLFDAATARRNSVLRGHTTHVSQVIWSPDGTRLASAGRDGAIKLWDPVRGREALNLSGNASQVNRVAWNCDGMTLASVGDDGQVRFHDATPGHLAARSAKLLVPLERRLKDESSGAETLRLLAEVRARQLQWDAAGALAREYLSRKPGLSWLLLDGLTAGPFSRDMNESCAPEDADPLGMRPASATKEAAPAGLTWRCTSESAQGLVDLGAVTDRANHVSAYVLFPIYSPTEREVALLMGSDDQSRIWLNDERVYESLVSRSLTLDEDAVAVRLKAGWNRLLVRVANDIGQHALALRLSDTVADLARARAREAK